MPTPKRKRIGKSPRRSRMMKTTAAAIIVAIMRMRSTEPAAAFFDTAARRLGVKNEEIWMIGDDIRVDVGGAQQTGLKGVQVKTGKYRAGDLDGAIKPDLVLDSIADLKSLL